MWTICFQLISDLTNGKKKYLNLLYFYLKIKRQKATAKSFDGALKHIYSGWKLQWYVVFFSPLSLSNDVLSEIMQPPKIFYPANIIVSLMEKMKKRRLPPQRYEIWGSFKILSFNHIYPIYFKPPKMFYPTKIVILYLLYAYLLHLLDKSTKIVNVVFRNINSSP